MKITVTGGAGYLGSVLVPMLLEHRHNVTVIDTFEHQQPSLLAWCNNPRLTILNHDVRRHQQKLFESADVIIPLAALVGAPLCNKDRTTTWRVNTEAITDMLLFARADQTILFPMTNSGYGVGGESSCTEDSPLNPISEYGQSKCTAERAVLNHPRGVSFRFATLFGCSPRMRLDLLVNSFVLKAVRDGFIEIFEPAFRRNYLHVRDAASVFLFALEQAELKSMFGQAYNVGLSSANLTKAELWERIACHIPGITWHTGRGKDPDQRDYLVSNTKIEALGWQTKFSLDDGIKELIKAYTMNFDRTNFTNS